jgi:uncharacterized protein YkwD
MNRSKGFQFMLGVILGAVFFGSAAAYAAGIMAQPKTAAVVVDGKAVDLKGYLIDGSHYFQLRDLDEKLIPGGKDFSIVWDGENNQVLINTSHGYDPYETLPAAPVAWAAEQEQAMSIEEMKAEIVRLTNEARLREGLPELEALPTLMETAQAKAQDFRDNHYYSHTSPVYGTFGNMIKAALPQARSAGENIAPWRETAADVFEAWMDSPGHRANILAVKFTHIGVGIIEGIDGGYWWVQQFAGLK